MTYLKIVNEIDHNSNNKNRINRKIHFSTVGIYHVNWPTSEGRKGGGGVCISLIGKDPKLELNKEFVNSPKNIQGVKK